MKVIVIEGTSAECVETMRKLGMQEVHSDPGKVEMHEKEKKETKQKSKFSYRKKLPILPKSKPKSGKRKKRKMWTFEDDQKVKSFYLNRENHFDNGRISGVRLRAIARELGRTANAVEVRIIYLGMNHIGVLGTKHQRHKTKKRIQNSAKAVATVKRKQRGKWTNEMRERHGEKMRAWHREKRLKNRKETLASAKKEFEKEFETKKEFTTKKEVPRFPPFEPAEGKVSFPILKTTKIGTEQMKELLKGIIDSKSYLTRKESPVIGIATEADFRLFLEEFATKAYEVAAYFKVPNKFIIRATNDELSLRYG